MKRLTWRGKDGDAYISGIGNISMLYENLNENEERILTATLNRLADYEDTGLAPNMIAQNEWIPVTETLPPADEWVLVTVQNMLGQTWVQRAEYSHSKEIWSDGKYGISGVRAWQKLPEPYDGGAE